MGRKKSEKQGKIAFLIAALKNFPKNSYRFFVNYKLAILTAAIYFTIFPLLSLSPLAFVFLVPVLIALSDESVTVRKAFNIFWVAGFFGNIGKQYWLVYTMNHYGFIPYPLALLVFGLMNATLGCFWGFMGAGAFYIKKHAKAPWVLVMPAAWVVMEWCLTWVLSGFPWELAGNSLINILPLAQAGDIFGVYGLSFFVIFGNVALSMIYFRYVSKTRESFPVREVSVFALMLVIVLVYGLVRLPQVERALERGTPIKVGLIQGNIDQNRKWNMSQKEIRRHYQALTKEVAEAGAELIIFPETALTKKRSRNWESNPNDLTPWTTRFATRYERYALVGYPLRIDIPAIGDRPAKIFKHNVATLVSPEGSSIGTAMKHKLVPFGEFLPFPDQVIWLKNTIGLKKARLTKGFMPAKGYNSIEYPPAGRFSVAICYEVIFPAMVRKMANLDTNFMVTITNDSWFGDSSAPHMHVDQVAMRAIEVRRSFARSANTGISCVVDATGRVRGETPTYKQSATVEQIRTIDIRSVYARIGDIFVYAMIALMLGLGIKGAVNKRKKNV